jgi:hypothetical protein
VVKDDSTGLILHNIPSRYAPDPRTYRIISRLMDSLPVNVGQEAIVESFYNYFDATIKTVGVSSIEQSWIDNILGWIPHRTRYLYPELIASLLEEVNEGFVVSSRQSAVDYILRKPESKTMFDIYLIIDKLQKMLA